MLSMSSCTLAAREKDRIVEPLHSSTEPVSSLYGLNFRLVIVGVWDMPSAARDCMTHGGILKRQWLGCSMERYWCGARFPILSRPAYIPVDSQSNSTNSVFR